MANLFDYIKDSQFESFYDRPFNKLDTLALTELSYLPFDGLLSLDFTQKGTRLDHLAKEFDKKYRSGFPPFSMATKDRLLLFHLLAQSKRFKYVKAFGYVNDYQLDQQKQFAALSYRLDREFTLTCFRGTDDTIIGWKEDFHMTYMEEIPAQRAAKDYLERLMFEQAGFFYVAGHSKGGNLALYASSQLAGSLQERILAVYPFDAPGLHKKHLESASYRAIAHRVHPVIPQNSVVGMMLDTPEGAQIVKSNTIGLLQHISFSWEIDKDDFKPAPGLTESSLQVDQTLKTWTASLSEEELRDFFDLFFGVFIQAGVFRLGDFTVDTVTKFQKIIQNSKNMTPEQQAMMERISRLLIDTRMQIWKDNLPELPKLTELKLFDQLPIDLQGKMPQLDGWLLAKKLRTLIPDKQKDES